MYEDLRSLDDLSLDGRRVFIRVDFDVPLKNGEVANDTLLRRTVPTIKKVQSAGARVVLGSHLGEPGGQHRRELGLEAVGIRLAELLGNEIYLPDDSIGDAARKVVQDLRPGQVCLLENLGFHSEEEANDEGFARKLAELADVYVNDAPRALDRRHASTELLPRLFRQRGMGYLLAAELSALSRFRENIAHPLVAVIGGARASRKLALLESLLGRADVLCVAGVVGNSLLRARGQKLGKSLTDIDALARGRAFLARARERKIDVLLPTDLVVAEGPDATRSEIVPSGRVPDDGVAVDIGPETVAAFRRVLTTAKSAFQHGALGVIENAAFGSGTREILGALAGSEAFHVAFGASALAAIDDADSFSKSGFISAGGDASLELLSGRKLPSLEALRGGET